MLSQVTFTIEHSDETDGVQGLIDFVCSEYGIPSDVMVTDYTVSVDMDPDSI